MTGDPLRPLELTFDELADRLKRRYGKGRFHARAIYHALFEQFSPSVHLSPDIRSSPVLARSLEHDVAIAPGDIVEETRQDGVIKFVTRLTDGHAVESVILPMVTHRTVCISTQVGCRMGCAFCQTARMGLVRQLRVEEIVGQVVAARRRYDRGIRNVVFMGMGEPFDNFDRVVQAIRVLNDQRGMDIALRYMTVSTVGLLTGIRKLGALGMPHLKLAVSLNAPDDRIRSTLMPVNRANPMDALRRELMAYPLKKGDTIMVAYVLIPGVNDSDAHAAALSEYLRPLPAKVNLIPFNPGTESPYRAPTEDAVQRFVDGLKGRAIQVQQRSTRGRELMAACGQLGSGYQPDVHQAVADR